MPPERLKMLQTQQEVQNKILLQKIELARVMEAESEGPHFPPQTSVKQRSSAQSAPSKSQSTTTGLNRVEPKFILEKGVPRLNPKYVEPLETTINSTGQGPS